MKIWQMVTWEGLVTWKSNLIQVVETRKDNRRLKITLVEIIKMNMLIMKLTKSMILDKINRIVEKNVANPN